MNTYVYNPRTTLAMSGFIPWPIFSGVSVATVNGSLCVRSPLINALISSVVAMGPEENEYLCQFLIIADVR